MGRIIVSENMTLDGVIEDPAGAEGFERGGWIGRIGDHGREEAGQILLGEAMNTEAMLLGRYTYEFFAARWPARTGALADRLNTKPKYVVSSTLKELTWNNTTLVQGDVVQRISELKRQMTGDLIVPGSIQLFHLLWKHDLVDELRVMVYPVVLGAGKRLFGQTEGQRPLQLVKNRVVSGDLAYLTYQPA